MIRKRIIPSVVILVFLSFSFSIVNVILAGNIPRQAGNESFWRYQYAGTMHLHTEYSDGSGTYGTVIAVADSLGMDFIIPCDHNTVEPMRDGWAKYVGGMLVIPGVEQSMGSNSGHYLAIGESVPLVKSSSTTSVEIYHACADSNILIFPAHIYHPRHNAWEHWDEGRFTGFELFNLDENWRLNLRLHSVHRLLAALALSPFRDDILNYLIVYPAREIATFDSIAATRPVVGIGSTDAHSAIRIAKGDKEKGEKDTLLKFPAYYQQLKLVQMIIETSQPFSGEYTADRALVLDAYRRGHCYIGFSGLENPRGFRFRATDRNGAAAMGDSLVFGDDATLNVAVPDSVNTEIRIFRNGAVVHTVRNAGSVSYPVSQPGVYRVEVFQRRLTLPFFIRKAYPWIISNPIYCVAA